MARGRFSKRPAPEIECWDCGDLISACLCDEAIHANSIGEVVASTRQPHDDNHRHHYVAPTVPFIDAERGAEIEKQNRAEWQASRERARDWMQSL